MSALYPLKFEPIFKSMLWGGRRLKPFLGRPHHHDEPVGEAWVLSDVDGHPSRVANGPLAGTTLRDLLADSHRRILGPAKPANGRFPLLLKFIDARQELSVQVHPNDAQAHGKKPGQAGKTEAWVILDADPATSKIYAGFRPGVTADTFRSAMADRAVHRTLHQFTPAPGDCVFLRAGTVHAIGANILLFEVQQTSDITYRLYDWDRVDTKTGRPRELHVEEGLACADFTTGPCHPVTAHIEYHEPARRERLVGCEYFSLHRMMGAERFTVGARGQCRVVVCVAGTGTLAGEQLGVGDAVLLPAEVGAAELVPHGNITVLECGVV
jgi:mannose-6-phosphate isomerase